MTGKTKPGYSPSPSVPYPDKVGGIIVAAGNSQRMGRIDKILAPLNGKSLISYTIDVFQQCAAIHQIVIVLNKSNLGIGRELVDKLGWSKVTGVYAGGRRRQDSVAQGINHLKDCQWVVIHDGARPCITRELIERGLNHARDTGAAIAAVPAQETIKIDGGDGIIAETPDRSCLWVAQTPQVFRFDIIAEAYRQAATRGREITDDAALVEAAGYKVKLYPGSYDNIKVTTPQDLTLAEIILRKERESSHIVPSAEYDANRNRL